MRTAGEEAPGPHQRLPAGLWALLLVACHKEAEPKGRAGKENRCRLAWLLSIPLFPTHSFGFLACLLFFLVTPPPPSSRPRQQAVPQEAPLWVLGLEQPFLPCLPFWPAVKLSLNIREGKQRSWLSGSGRSDASCG